MKRWIGWIAASLVTCALCSTAHADELVGELGYSGVMETGESSRVVLGDQAELNAFSLGLGYQLDRVVPNLQLLGLWQTSGPFSQSRFAATWTWS